MRRLSGWPVLVQAERSAETPKVGLASKNQLFYRDNLDILLAVDRTSVVPLVVFTLMCVACGGASPTAPTTTSSGTGPPLLLRSIGVDLGTYNPATGRAGDFLFVSAPLPLNRIWTDYGHIISGAMTSTGQDKANPQPTFLLPLGTKVRSLVDGVVVAVPTLYSGDVSVQVASSAESIWIYETEHVINPAVRVGDRVTAGQIIAEVSPFDAHNQGGLGIVEIGLLKGGSPPNTFVHSSTSTRASRVAFASAFVSSI